MLNTIYKRVFLVHNIVRLWDHCINVYMHVYTSFLFSFGCVFYIYHVALCIQSVSSVLCMPMINVRYSKRGHGFMYRSPTMMLAIFHLVSTIHHIRRGHLRREDRLLGWPRLTQQQQQLTHAVPAKIRELLSYPLSQEKNLPSYDRYNVKWMHMPYFTILDVSSIIVTSNTYVQVLLWGTSIFFTNEVFWHQISYIRYLMECPAPKLDKCPNTEYSIIYKEHLFDKRCQCTISEYIIAGLCYSWVSVIVIRYFLLRAHRALWAN